MIARVEMRDQALSYNESDFEDWRALEGWAKHLCETDPRVKAIVVRTKGGQHLGTFTAKA